MKRLYVLLLLLIAGHADAQFKRTIEELLNGLETEVDSNRVKILNDLCVRYRDSDPKSALLYGFEGVELAKELQNKKRLSFLYNDIGTVYGQQENYLKALEYFVQSLEMKRQLGDPRAIANSLVNISYVYQYENDCEKAIEYATRALNMAMTIEDIEYQIDSKNRLAFVLMHCDQPEKALDICKSLLSLCEEQKSHEKYSLTLDKIGKIHRSIGEDSIALVWVRRRFKYDSTRGDLKGMGSSLHNLGTLMHDLGAFDAGIDHMEEGLNLYEEIGDSLGMMQIKSGLAQRLLDELQYVRSIRYAQSALAIAQKRGIISASRPLTKILHQCHDSLGHTAKAYALYKDYIKVSDSLNRQSQVKEIKEIQGKFDTKELENELELQKQLALKQKLSNVAIIIGLSCLCVLLFLVYRLQLSKAKINRANGILKQQEITILQCKQSELLNEIEYKKRELSTFTLNLVHKNNVIAELKKNVFKIQKKVNDEDVSRKLYEITRKMEACITIDKDWEEFKFYFEQVHAGFFYYLRENFPDLTSNELRICALSRLNLSMKEKASILGISSDSVKMARYRIRKKIQMDSNIDFNAYFMLIHDQQKEYHIKT